MADAWGVTVSDVDEFSFLEAEAASLGLPLTSPAPRRVQLSPEVSAIAWGAGAAQTVLVHGAALNAHTWDATVIALTAHASTGPILAVDLPGHGDSPWRDDADYSPVAIAGPLAGALAAAVDAGLLSPGFTFVGHSLGGLTGLELLRRGEQAFGRLILADILPLPPEGARAVAEFLAGPSSFASRDEVIERALAFGFGGDREGLERGVILNTRVRPDGSVVWKHHLGALGPSGFPRVDSEALWQAIAEATTPIDLIAGDASFINEALTARFTELQPQARVRVLPGGHNLQEDVPVALADTIVELSAAKVTS